MIISATKSFRRHWQFYVLILPALLYLLIFKYVPMAGVVLAFKDYNVVKGIWGSAWAGWKYFQQFFANPSAPRLITNTLYLSLLQLAIGFPMPILLALALNEVRSKFFRKTVQMVTYAPYFISTVVMVSVVMLVLSPQLGLANQLLGALGFKPVNLLGNPDQFRLVYVLSEVWQHAGYSAVIYLAALSAIDPTLYEAARVDGASKIQKVLNVDIPGLLPTIVIILILNVGNLMAVGFEKIYLLQNPLNLSSSEIISTYVYKIGLLNANYSFASAVGLFNSVINLILLVIINAIARKISENSLW